MFFDDDQMIALHGGENPAIQQRAVVPPIYMNSLHVFPNMASYLGVDVEKEYIYGRVSNPTVHLLEEKLAALERGTRGLVFSSGMAALTTAIHACCKTGDHIICLYNCYGPTVEFLKDICIPKLNMQVTFVEATAEAVTAAIRPETTLVLLESPTSLVLEVIDIQAITRVTKARGIRTYIDNTYCTQLYQKPLTLGIDIVMHTLSKYLGGHSDVIGGALVCQDEQLGRDLARCREFYGGIIGPMEGWLVLRGLRSLSVRLAQHQHRQQQRHLGHRRGDGPRRMGHCHAALEYRRWEQVLDAARRVGDQPQPVCRRQHSGVEGRRAPAGDDDLGAADVRRQVGW